MIAVCCSAALLAAPPIEPGMWEKLALLLAGGAVGKLSLGVIVLIGALIGGYYLLKRT